MLRSLNHRAGHYAALLAAWALLALPYLGTPSLWDIDEGLNAEASREMLERGDWVVPTFNYELRTAKPALINWLQMLAYSAFGVDEWSARLPSAVAVALTALLTYELGRLMFGAATGLLGGVVLLSAAAVCGAARFANPDALLLLCTTLTLLLFWQGHHAG